MADFCTTEQVEDLLQIDISDADKLDSVERAITAATAAIKNHCHQTIEEVADDVYTFDLFAPVWNLVLPEMPVTSVASVVEDGETLTAGSDEDYVVMNYGQIRRIGSRWETGPQIVTVTYTHGYATIPDDVIDVCTRAAARAYQAGLKASEAAAVPGVSSMSLGDYSVSYSETEEVSLGVSGARLLLMSEKDSLDKYRYVGP